MRKHVLITGGARGIGAALVRLFSRNGFRVSFTYFQSKDSAVALSNELGARAYCVDLSDPENAKAFAASLCERGECPDVLIHNAGLASYGLFQDVTPETFRKVSAVNFQSPFFLTQGLVPEMISRKSGVIINIASVWGQCGASCEVLYSATKSALIGFTKALAKELAPCGISINCVAPAAVDTDMLASFNEQERQGIADEYPIGRLICAEEIAETCLFLAQNKAPALTGQVIAVNGGYYC